VARDGCVTCGRPIGKRGEVLYLRPDGSAAALCGKQACEDKYNGVKPE
jgi:hypothetical protein